MVDGTASVTLQFVFTGLVPAAPRPATLDTRWWEVGTPPPVSNTSVAIPGQQWLRPGLRWRAYGLYVAPWDTFVSRMVAVDARAGGNLTITVNLINGDANKDGEIGPADFSQVLSGFGTESGDPGYNPDSDLDKNGEVGPSDFSVVLTGFGTENEGPP